MKIKKILENRIFALIVCVIFVGLAALYYYGLQCEYPPEGEVIMSISSMYAHLTMGKDYTIHEFLYALCSFVATKIGGMSFFSVRLFLSILYTILLCFTMFLCLKSKTREGINLYLLPLVALFSVILFSTVDNPEWVQDPGGKDFLYVWPFHYHYTSRIYALVCLALTMLVFQYQGKKRRIVYSVLLAAVCIYAAKTTDLIFYISFLAPAAIVTMLYIVRKTESRKYIVYLACGGMGILFLTKVLPFTVFDRFWSKEKTSVYSAIYGNSNWISPDALFDHLSGYVEINLLNFNIPIAETPVISFNSVIFGLKIVILLVGYILMFHIIICYFTGKNADYRYDCVDAILAWSYLLISFVFIFTDLGTVRNSRYFSEMTTIMTVLLCRNIEVFPNIVHINIFNEIKYKKALFFAFTFVICVCTMSKVWKHRAPDEFGADLEAIIEYIDDTGYGYAVAPYWFYPLVSAMSDGKVMAFETENQIKSMYGDDAKAAYIITWNYNNEEDDYWSKVFISTYKHCGSYEEICEYYSEPTDIIFYDDLQLVVFEDGIEFRE